MEKCKDLLGLFECNGNEAYVESLEAVFVRKKGNWHPTESIYADRADFIIRTALFFIGVALFLLINHIVCIILGFLFIMLSVTLLGGNKDYFWSYDLGKTKPIVVKIPQLKLENDKMVQYYIANIVY